MFENFLPSHFIELFNQIKVTDLYEIRLRINCPIVVNVLNNIYFLTNSGLNVEKKDAILCSPSDIRYIIDKVSNGSMYSIMEQLINGFITISGGIRIGIAGDVVYNADKVKTIKNITSLNIRIPHVIKNCSLNVYNFIIENGKINNTLIISPPGCGKTTFLRDLIYQINLREKNINILVADERNEICGLDNNYNNVDIYANCSKQFAFENGIRSMKPDIILTDEINFNKDIEILENAVTCGVKVVATIHAKDIEDLKKKKLLNYILNNKLFDRYIVLSNKYGNGTCEGVYNENLSCIYV